MLQPPVGWVGAEQARTASTSWTTCTRSSARSRTSTRPAPGSRPGCTIRPGPGARVSTSSGRNAAPFPALRIRAAPATAARRAAREPRFRAAWRLPIGGSRGRGLCGVGQVLVPKDHVSRSPNDTYYVNSETVLRCHTSAHQVPGAAAARPPCFPPELAVTCSNHRWGGWARSRQGQLRQAGRPVPGSQCGAEL